MTDEVFKNIPMSNNVNDLAAMLDHMGSDVSMQRGRPYSGQPWTTDGVRGNEIIRNITFRDMRDCFVRGFILSHQSYKEGTMEPVEPNYTLITECQKGVNAAICQNDMYTLVGDIDPMAVWQNIHCEIEKMMGIFPNIDPVLKKGIE
jgi:hypothetical protein